MNNFLSKDMIIDFIPSSSLRKLYITSQVARGVLSKIASFYITCYITLYKQTKKDLKDLKIGIIGLGHMGSTILQEFIRLKPLPLENILVSTRCPERHQEYLETGVNIF